MAGQTEFLQAIQELERLGETNGNQLSMEEINAYFSDMKLEEKQLDFICNYFESHQIYITNRIERQEEEIGDEELPNKEDPMDAEIVAFYLKEMEKANSLSGEQERVIARKLVSGDDTARNLLIEANLSRAVEIAKEYDLRIESQKYQFYLRGSEQNRRKMIGSLAVRNTYGFFNSKDALEQLFPSQDIDGIMQELFTTCQESKLFLNDFALNNLLIHILVILIRLNIGNELDDKEPPISVDELLASSQDREDIVNLADMISTNFEQKYSIRIPERDYKQILMLIALSVEHETVDIQCVISPEFIHNVASILSMMSQRYCTPEFDNDYILQFSLHMYYAQQRCAFHISYPNPIALQFKKDYAPVYDMAVYFAHRFAQIYHIEVSEDEIAFIAFHIGSYLENNKQSREHATCVVIVESYHMLARQLIHEINVAFANQIIVKEVLPLNRYLNRQPECDLVLTTLPLGIQHPHVVQISPILTKANCEGIRAQLSSISTERELARAHQFLQSLLHKELYFRNVSLSDAAAYIHFMGEQCVKHGYAKEEFVQDVLQRESFSSTAFTDVLAVPHAINQYADRSFICVIHNDMPIQWKKKTVHFVLMIGITEAEMKFFKPAFDRIVELFNSTSRTLELLKTNTFEEFCAQMR